MERKELINQIVLSYSFYFIYENQLCEKNEPHVDLNIWNKFLTISASQFSANHLNVSYIFMSSQIRLVFLI